MRKTKTILSILTIGILMTGCANNGLYKSEKNVTNAFMNSIKDYDYEQYMGAITDDLADTSNIILDSETDTENIALYGNKIEGKIFDKMYASILGGVIQGYEYKSSEKTDKKTFETENADDDKEKTEETSTQNEVDKTSEEEKTEKDAEQTAKDSENIKKDDNIDGYYLVKGIVKVPTVESIKNEASDIFNKNIDKLFSKKLENKETATKAMVDFFTKGFADVYSSSNKEEKDVQFIVVKYKDGTFKVNDSDFFNTLYSVYSYANEAIGNSNLYSNKNAYDAYLRISLNDEEYKKQISAGETITDDKKAEESGEEAKTDDENSSTSWKNKIN